MSLSLQTSIDRVSKALNLPSVSSEEEASAAIIALLTSAAHDTQPRFSLSTIFSEISQAGAASLIDPLNTLPLLLPCKNPAAKDILALMGECSPPKEVLIAVQEAIERLESAYEDEDGDEDDGKDASVPDELVTLIELYSSCIPRLKLRRKTASETISPLCSDLESALHLCGGCSSRDQGRTLLVSVSHLVEKTATWSKSRDDKDDIYACNVVLKSLLDCALAALEHCIKSSLTQRSFESFFPRLTVRSAITPGWEGGEEAVSNAIAAYAALGISEPPTSALSTASMIVLAHTTLDSIGSDILLSMMPILIASLQTGSALDEALAILLHGMDPLRPLPRPALPDEITQPLHHILPPLCSTHPDPLVRHQVYRILALLVLSFPSETRLHFLHDLATSPYPQMCVAALGLIKETIFEAIAHPSDSYITSLFFKHLGPVIFLPCPPDLFANPALTLVEFKDSSEPARLVECLGLYYTLLQRDQANLTHIRDPDVLSRVEDTFLRPLRITLERWASEHGSEGHMHDMMPLISLQMSLERVDGARSGI